MREEEAAGGRHDEHAGRAALTVPCAGERYTVSPLGDGWAIYDTASGGRLVRWYPSQATAESAAIFGNILGCCRVCSRPGSVQVMGQVFCVDCIPDGAVWGVIPLDGYRRWRTHTSRG